MDKLIYLVYPALLAVLVVGMRISKKTEWNEEFMSLEQVKYLQGFTALLIMCHHLGQKTCAPWQPPTVIVHGLDLFVNYGFYFVSIFLFCTGYGLYKSFMTKENYLKGYFVKRILPLIITFYTVGIIFLIVRLLLGQKMDAKQIVFYLTGIQFANPNSWYLVAVPFFYMFFYFCFKFIRDEKKASIATCLCILGYILLGTYIRHNPYWMCGEWWYQSSPFFAFGILFARKDQKIIAHVKRHYLFYLIGAFIGIFVFDFVANIANVIFSYYYGEYYPMPVPRFSMMWRKWVTLLAHVLGASAYVFFIFIAMLKVKIGNRVLGFMGTITLEFYIIHGLFVELFGFNFDNSVKSLVYIKNPAFHLVITLVLSILSAIVLKKWVDIFRVKKKSE